MAIKGITRSAECTLGAGAEAAGGRVESVALHTGNSARQRYMNGAFYAVKK